MISIWLVTSPTLAHYHDDHTVDLISFYVVLYYYTVRFGHTIPHYRLHWSSATSIYTHKMSDYSWVESSHRTLCTNHPIERDLVCSTVFLPMRSLVSPTTFDALLIVQYTLCSLHHLSGLNCYRVCAPRPNIHTHTQIQQTSIRMCTNRHVLYQDSGAGTGRHCSHRSRRRRRHPCHPFLGFKCWLCMSMMATVSLVDFGIGNHHHNRWQPSQPKLFPDTVG